MWAWGRGGGTEDVTMGTWHWWGGGTGGVTVGGTVVTWGRPALPCPNPSVAMPPPGDVPPLHGDTPIPPTPQRFQEVEEAHLRHMKGLIGSYSHSVEDTHVQIGQVSPPSPPQSHGDTPRVPLCIPLHRSLQVHEEFKQNVENIGTETLLRRFAESKGTGRERPGEEGGGGGARSQGGGGGQLCMGTLLPSWLTPRLLSGTLDFEEYRLAPAQEGEYVCPPLSPVLGGALGGAAHCFVPPPPPPPPQGPRGAAAKPSVSPG